MKVFKNVHFIKRDFDCTNVIACLADTQPNKDDWCEVSPEFIENLDYLYRQGDVKYYGYL